MQHMARDRIKPRPLQHALPTKPQGCGIATDRLLALTNEILLEPCLVLLDSSAVLHTLSVCGAFGSKCLRNQSNINAQR